MKKRMRTYLQTHAIKTLKTSGKILGIQVILRYLYYRKAILQAYLFIYFINKVKLKVRTYLEKFNYIQFLLPYWIDLQILRHQVLLEKLHTEMHSLINWCDWPRCHSCPRAPPSLCREMASWAWKEKEKK